MKSKKWIEVLIFRKYLILKQFAQGGNFQIPTLYIFVTYCTRCCLQSGVYSIYVKRRVIYIIDYRQICWNSWIQTHISNLIKIPSSELDEQVLPYELLTHF